MAHKKLQNSPASMNWTEQQKNRSPTSYPYQPDLFNRLEYQYSSKMASQTANFAQRITRAAGEILRHFAVHQLPVGTPEVSSSPPQNTAFRRDKALAKGRVVEIQHNTLTCAHCGNQIYVLTREKGTTNTARFEQSPSNRKPNYTRCVDEYDTAEIQRKFRATLEEHEAVLLSEKMIEVWEDENANSYGDEDEDVGGEHVVYKVRFGSIECVECEGNVDIFCDIKSDKESEVVWSTS